MFEVGYLVAFTSGLVSFFAPCVVPLLPAYIAYVSGVSVGELKEENGKGYKRRVLVSSVVYILGFSVVFVLLGTAAAGVGGVVRRYTDLIEVAGGVMVMVFALGLLGVIRLPLGKGGAEVKLPKWTEGLGYGRAFLLGVVFASIWTPCVGTVLGVILTLAATSETVGTGALLLFVYSLGISVPFLLTSVLIAHAPVMLKGIGKYMEVLVKVTGGTLLVIGFLMFNNKLGLVSDQLTYDKLNGWLFEQAYRWGFVVR